MNALQSDLSVSNAGTLSNSPPANAGGDVILHQPTARSASVQHPEPVPTSTTQDDDKPFCWVTF